MTDSDLARDLRDCAEYDLEDLPLALKAAGRAGASSPPLPRAGQPPASTRPEPDGETGDPATLPRESGA